MAAGGFLTRAFETMLKESGGKKYPDLQKAIQAYQDGSKVVTQAASSSIDESSQAEGGGEKTGGEADEPQKLASAEMAEQASQSKSGTINISLANAGHTLGGAEVELVLKPLRLAFETKNLKIFDAALDCLHKLIAYDHLEGDPGLDGGKNSAPFTDILNMVCSCVDNSSPDSTVLQVLKVLLTAVASGKFKVHGEPLLGVIRVCYNIALNSKSPINQATSKAMLTQMISIVFRRMETDIVSASSTVSQEENVSGDSSSRKNEEITAADENEKEMTLGDALTQAKDTTLASVEELHTLVGGADIKVPRDSLEFAITSFGGTGMVSWEGEGAPFKEDDESITHHIIDKPSAGHLYLSREYVQPQWIYDCVNARIILPTEEYMVGRTLPPHLSPFVDNEAEGYVPDFAKTISILQAAARNKVVPLPDVGKEDPQNLLYAGVMSRAEEAEAAEIRKKMAALEKQYHEELKKELTGSVMDEGEGGEEASVPDSEQIAKDNVDMLRVMMSSKDRKLDEAIKIGQRRKKEGVERIKARKESLTRCNKV